MTNKPTGGPAFPSLNPTMTGIDSDGFERFDTEPCGGLTVRDYFAIRAFQTRLAKHLDWTLDELTDQAWLDADAMLKARQ